MAFFVTLTVICAPIATKRIGARQSDRKFEAVATAIIPPDGSRAGTRGDLRAGTRGGCHPVLQPGQEGRVAGARPALGRALSDPGAAWVAATPGPSPRRVAVGDHPAAPGRRARGRDGDAAVRARPHAEAKLYYTTMVQDESRHTEAWLKLIPEAGGYGERDPYLDQMGKLVIGADTLEEKVFLMQVF